MTSICQYSRPFSTPSNLFTRKRLSSSYDSVQNQADESLSGHDQSHIPDCFVLTGGGMLAGALYGGVLEEAGPFGIVWASTCLAIMALAIYSAFNRKVIDQGMVEIDAKPDTSHPETVEARLKRIDGLKHNNRLITDEMYRIQRIKMLVSL